MVLAEWNQQQPRLLDAKTCCSFFQYCDEYSTCTNVNNFFFPNAQARIWAWYPCLKTRSRMFTRARKWSLVPCVHTVFISVLGQSTAKLMFQNGVRQGEME